MNIDLLGRYNALVKPEDEVFCLGDCCLGGADAIEENYQLMKQLNGLIHIIRGNHDTDLRLDMYARLPNVVEISEGKFWKYGKYNFYLSHFACATTNFDIDKSLKHRTLCLCGHRHTPDKFLDIKEGAYHVEVDCHNNNPVNIEDIITDLKWWHELN